MEKRTELNVRTSVGDRGVRKRRALEMRRPRALALVAEGRCRVIPLRCVARAHSPMRTRIGSRLRLDKSVATHISTHLWSSSSHVLFTKEGSGARSAGRITRSGHHRVRQGCGCVEETLVIPPETHCGGQGSCSDHLGRDALSRWLTCISLGCSEPGGEFFSAFSQW